MKKSFLDLIEIIYCVNIKYIINYFKKKKRFLKESQFSWMGFIKVLRVIVCFLRFVGIKLLDVNSRKCQIGENYGF